MIRSLLARSIPTSAVRQLRRLTRYPRVGGVDLGDLRRLSPISKRWGFDRGLPIDRYFIEKFLESHRSDLRGAVLEVGDATYTKKFAAAELGSIDVVHFAEGNPAATIVADLCQAPQIEDGRFDCIICTQTLQFVSDPAAAIATLYRILRPGGVLLLTAPCLSQLDLDPSISWADRWRFTTTALRELAQACTGEGDHLEVSAFGNVLAATAFLQGLASGELEAKELDATDHMFEMLVTMHLQKKA
ncbi:MAG: SAM-dependent methyltransferase [Verrucomicrobiales bacterium]|jgi:SAM-dependent methyltransferase